MLVFDFGQGLVKDNLIVVDRATDSVWSQLHGKAIDGPLTGTAMKVVPALQATWGYWRDRHPNTLVMQIEGLRAQPYRYRSVGKQRDSPGHDTSDLGLGLVLGEEAFFAPLDTMARHAQPIRIKLGGKNVTLHSEPGGLTAWAEDANGTMLPGILAYRSGWLRFHPGSLIFPSDTLADSEDEILRTSSTEDATASDRIAVSNVPDPMSSGIDNGLTNLNLSSSGLAIDGYDPVAYQREQRAIPGDSRFTSRHGEAVFHFASSENRSVFDNDPTRYVPAYGGWCAFGMGMTEGYAPGFSAGFYDVDPECFKVLDGRLHLFFRDPSWNALAAWNKDEQRLKERAASLWRRQTSGERMHGLDPRAPDEMVQFAFLVGEFDVEMRTRDATGRVQQGRHATWTGRYTLNGHAFQDDYTSIDGTIRGTTWRTYDPLKKRWTCIWMQAGTDTPSGWTPDYFYGRESGGDLILEFESRDASGQPLRSRAVFSERSDRGFTWRYFTSQSASSWGPWQRELLATRREP